MGFKEYLENDLDSTINWFMNKLFSKYSTKDVKIALKSEKEVIRKLSIIIKNKIPEKYTQWQQELSIILKSLSSGNASIYQAKSQLSSTFNKWSLIIRNVEENGV